MHLICLVTAQNKRATWFYGRKFSIVSHFPAKFGGLRNCCIGDLTVLVFHVILKDHVIKWLCDFMEGDLSLHVTTLPSLVAMSIALVEMYFLNLSCSLTRPLQKRIM